MLYFCERIHISCFCRDLSQVKLTPDGSRSPERGWDKLDSAWTSDTAKVPSNEASGEETGEVRDCIYHVCTITLMDSVLYILIHTKQFNIQTLRRWKYYIVYWFVMATRCTTSYIFIYITYKNKLSCDNRVPSPTKIKQKGRLQ